MKTLLLFLFIAITCVSPYLYGQTIVTTKIINVPCCNSSDSIDYNSDGNYDFKIISSVGEDNSYFYTQGIGNTQITNIYDYGQILNGYSSTGGLTGTTIMCFGWYSYWEPGTGTFQYMGFRDITTANDTIYGWIKIGFNGVQNTCEDTMVTSTVAYSQTANLHLTAGQTTVTGVENYSSNATNLFELKNNQNDIYLISKSNTSLNIKVYNIIGQEVFNINDLTFNQSRKISQSNFSTGLFFIIGITGNLSQTCKIFVK
jgi:hypothetical protein